MGGLNAKTDANSRKAIGCAKPLNVANMLIVLVVSLLLSLTLRIGWNHTQRLKRVQGLHAGLISRIGCRQCRTYDDKRLIMVIPFVGEDVDHIIEAIRSWAALGPLCSSASAGKVDLFFYYHLDIDETTAAFATRLSELDEWAQMGNCFHLTGIETARLSSAEDRYPEGPSNMFYAMFDNRRLQSFLQPYHHMFWMEWDTFPVKPLWVDALVAEASEGDFWMKGSIYGGPAFDAAVLFSFNWNWVGHLNGNALYKLRDPEFNAFLEVVREYEPPNDYWKPFDIAIWKVLNDFPYMWKFYQQYIIRFVVSDYIVHHGFTITEQALQASQDNPRTFLIHGSNSSAGNAKYQAKFPEGKPKEEVPAEQWTGAVPASMNVSVMMRSFIGDIEESVIALESVLRYFPGAKEVILVVPTPDLETFRTRIPQGVVLHGEDLFMDDGHVQHKYTTLNADLHCSGDLVFMIDSDVVMHRQLLRKDILFHHKPMIAYVPYASLPKELQRWQQGTSFAIGSPVMHEFSRGSQFRLLPRIVFEGARTHLEKLHQKSVREFLKTRKGILEFEPDILLLFSDINYLNAYAYAYHHDLINWFELGVANDPHPIVPAFVCQGNARIAQLNEGSRKEHLRLLRNVMMGTTPCTYFEDWCARKVEEEKINKVIEAAKLKKNAAESAKNMSTA